VIPEFGVPPRIVPSEALYRSLKVLDFFLGIVQTITFFRQELLHSAESSLAFLKKCYQHRQSLEKGIC